MLRVSASNVRGVGAPSISKETLSCLFVLYLQKSGQDAREFLHSCEPVSHNATVL